MKTQLTLVKAREYAHELMKDLLSEENLKESENLFINTTNRGFNGGKLKLSTPYGEMRGKNNETS